MKRFSRSIRAKLTILFISILLISCLSALGIVIIATPNLNEIITLELNREVIHLLTATVILCAGIGSVLMFIATKFISKPIRHISDVTKEVAKGNFEVHIDYQRKDEIGELASNFRLMAEELKNIEYLRKDFMRNVSHEFKTPISSIQGFVEVIKDRNLPSEKFDEYTDIIIEESKRLNNLSTNILRLSKLDNQMIQSKTTIFSLDEQLRRTILLLEEQWSKKNLALEIHLEKVSYKGNEELMQQLWINLIGNAIKFSYEKGTIYISLKKANDTFVVEIRDEGVGIAEESRSRIFEKFFQGDPSRSEKGNGLGLAIVKRIIEICNGTIHFDSQEGVGTCFTIKLPK
ncbi:signal transduction histidine kinase [Cytobacillus eiseniae]|uniref:Heme sensor protein HssS n=1 Tax=Cytobacillus eiseniae TaxID=762947 RepID=A0ABS4RGS0_9BACI|nr:HAMP domain-containing sensor histidine kinase [Cytobacillus eiseniae]MBP2242079.1 signal transduction histidine kinase [Cytobacillus eiseniae]